MVGVLLIALVGSEKTRNPAPTRTQTSGHRKRDRALCGRLILEKPRGANSQNRKKTGRRGGGILGGGFKAALGRSSGLRIAARQGGMSAGGVVAVACLAEGHSTTKQASTG